MTLRSQLFLVSLLMLALPWAGCQYIREMESALRQGHEDALLSTASAVAVMFERRSDLMTLSPGDLPAKAAGAFDIYAQTITSELTLDGYAGDWGTGTDELVDLSNGDWDSRPEARYAAGVRNGYYYLFIAVSDDFIKYSEPGSVSPATSDGIYLVCIAAGGERHDLWFSPEAPGPVSPIRVAPGVPPGRSHERELRVQGIWQETGSGYNLEVRIPAGFVGERCGFNVLSSGRGDNIDDLRVVGTLGGRERTEPGFLRHRLEPVQKALEDFYRPDNRIRVTDRGGWLIGEIGKLESRRATTTRYEAGNGLMEEIYLAVLDRNLSDPAPPVTSPGRLAGIHVETALAEGQPAAEWFRHPDDELSVLAVAHPIMSAGEVSGVAVVEQTSDAILTLTNHALTRLVNISLLVSFLAALGLLSYATWLSIRIRRLRDAADRAVRPDGRIVATLPMTASADELGDLSRSFDRLLRQLKEYTEYLKTLADKLTHELRTPLAIVQTSLDNLEAENLPEDSRVYAQRAMEGATRLQRILKAMSEASRIEESIRGAESQRFDLKTLLQNSLQAYRDLYTGRIFEDALPDESCEFSGVPELLAQMLDKLVENAVDFSDEQARIAIALSATDDAYILVVANEGQPLPETMRKQLFDSMVSVRETRDDEPHLGLGLFIVRLIVEFHAGAIQADNVAEGGAEFRITLPRRMTTKSTKRKK